MEDKLLDKQQRFDDEVASLDEKCNSLMKKLDDHGIYQMQHKLQETTHKFLEESATVMDEKLEKLKKDLGGCSAERIEHTLQEDLAEVEEIRRRKTNIIIHGLQEPVSSDRDSEQVQDENTVQNLLHELKSDDVSVNSITRLGRKPPGEGAKP